MVLKSANTVIQTLWTAIFWTMFTQWVAQREREGPRIGRRPSSSRGVLGLVSLGPLIISQLQPTETKYSCAEMGQKASARLPPW